MHAATSVHERMQREARISGLCGFATPSLEAVERRRFQLLLIALFFLLAFTATTALVVLWPGLPRPFAWMTSQVLGMSALILMGGFCFYIFEKERSLRRLTSLLIDERVLTAALSNRLRELSALAEAGRAINSVLNLDDVLDIILQSAMELLGGDSGSIMLLGGSDRLEVVSAYGNAGPLGARLPLGMGIAGKVAATGDAVLVIGPANPAQFEGVVARGTMPTSAMSVPLVNRGELLGVLNVSTAGSRIFSEYDLRSVGLFAEHAAISIANGRLYDVEARRVSELVEVNRMKSEFVAAVSHELRTPLTSILGSVITMRGLELDAEQREEFLDMVERQARRLIRMIEELLTAARLDEGLPAVASVPFDVTDLARQVARDLSFEGRTIDVDAPPSCPAVGDPGLLQQILTNLIDNAGKHGEPPFRMRLERSAEQVTVSVLDSGDGVRLEDRDRVFERFIRLDTTGHKPGIGLGLAIVRDLVTLCNGRVWVGDAPGGGAAFHVVLPLRATERVGT